MMLLYRNDRGDHWYAKGMELVQKELKQLSAARVHTGAFSC